MYIKQKPNSDNSLDFLNHKDTKNTKKNKKIFVSLWLFGASMRKIGGFFLLFLILLVNVSRAQQQQSFDPNLIKGLKWRSIGPYRGGRCTAVAGVTSQPFVYYLGATG